MFFLLINKAPKDASVKTVEKEIIINKPVNTPYSVGGMYLAKITTLTIRVSNFSNSKKDAQAIELNIFKSKKYI